MSANVHPTLPLPSLASLRYANLTRPPLTLQSHTSASSQTPTASTTSPSRSTTSISPFLSPKTPNATLENTSPSYNLSMPSPNSAANFKSTTTSVTILRPWPPCTHLLFTTKSNPTPKNTPSTPQP